MKDDWVIPGLGEMIIPRAELVQEFTSKTNGQHFAISTLPGALKLIGERKEIVEKAINDDIIGAKLEELYTEEQNLLEVANRLHAQAKAAESHALGITSHHPGRNPQPGETFADFEERVSHFYKYIMPIMKAGAEAEAVAAWEASNIAVANYTNALNARMAFEQEILHDGNDQE